MKTAVLVFAVALAARLIYAWQMRGCPLFVVPTIDAGAYYELAKRFAGGDWLAPKGSPYWQPVFYSMLLAVWIKLVGTSVWGIKLAQFTLGSVNCAMVCVLGTRVFDRRTGLVAGLAAALYAPLIYFDGELLTPTLQISLNLLCLLLLFRASERRSVGGFALAGSLFGLSIVTRPDVAVFLPALILWMILGLRKKLPAQRIVVCSAVMLLFAVLPTVPFAVRNRIIGHDRVLISSNGGLNFFIGNNPYEEETRQIRPGPDWDALQELPMKEDPKARPSQQDSWYYRRSFDYIREKPLWYAGLIVKKTVMFLSAVEGRRNHDLYHPREHSRLYSLLLSKTRGFAFPFGLVLPFALFGLLRHRPDLKSRLLCLYLLSQFLCVTAFFVAARYRVTSVPVLLIFAAFGALEMIDAARDKRWRGFVGPVTASLVLLIISNANIYGIDRDQQKIEADTYFYKANISLDLKDEAAARAYYLRSIDLNPDYEYSRYMYALFLMRGGDYPGAEEQFRECLRIEPDSPAANAGVGDALTARGDVKGAMSFYIAAAGKEPAFTDRLVSLAEEAYSRKDYRAAGRALSFIVEKRPEWAEARRGLGTVLMKMGRIDQAIRHLQRAVILDPSSSDSFIALGVSLRVSGRTRDAEKAFAKALEIGPEPAVRKKISECLASSFRKR